MTCSDKTRLILKHLETAVLNIECTETRKWLKQIFTHFLHYLQDHPLYKNLTAKLPTILDSFLLNIDCIRQVSTWVGGGGQDGSFKNFKSKA